MPIAETAAVSSSSSQRQATVAAGGGEDPLAALGRALEQARAFEALDRAVGERPRRDCSVVVKATLPPGSAERPVAGSYAAPELVEALAERLRREGWPHVQIAVAGPGGVAAAQRVGYAQGAVVDLSEQTVPYHYGGPIGAHPASRVWLDADARVIVGRARPDAALFYQAALVASLGAVPDSGALTARLSSPQDAAVCACEILESFPVAFGVLDATAAEGGRVLVGADLLALDWVFGELTGLDGPELNAVVREALMRSGRLHLTRLGDLDDLEGWPVPGALRAALAAAGAGRAWGALAGAKEVPWTDR